MLQSLSFFCTIFLCVGKFCGASMFAAQRPPTSDEMERTTGSTVVTKVLEVSSEKNAGEDMENPLLQQAAEDGVNAVHKMGDHQGEKEGEQEVTKEGEQQVSKEAEQEVSKEAELDVSKERVDTIPEPDLSLDVTLNQLKVQQKKKRAAAATDQGTLMMQSM